MIRFFQVLEFLLRCFQFLQWNTYRWQWFLLKISRSFSHTFFHFSISLFLVFSYFYLYKVSYLYTVVIGFFITFIVGYATSRLLNALKMSKADKIYIERDESLINFDLFFPPIAKSLRKQQLKKENMLLTTNNNGNLNVSWKYLIKIEIFWKCFFLDGNESNEIMFNERLSLQIERFWIFVDLQVEIDWA